MARSAIFAVATALALALAACSGAKHSAPAVPVVGADGAETVGDAAAIAAHQPTDSANAAAAIGAADALGSRVRSLADESAGDPANDSPRLDMPPDGADGFCQGGSQFFAPNRRGGDAHSTEMREFFDPGCTQLARDSVRIYRPAGPNAEIVERTVAVYDAGRSTPVAIRKESSQISNATLGRWGFPLARDGFSRTTSSSLWVSNREQSASDSEMVMLASLTNENEFCQDSAGYGTAGIPSLDATFGWEAATLESPGATTRVSDGAGSVTLSSTQGGHTFAGPVGSFSIVAAARNSACRGAARAFGLAGGTPSGAFTLPIRATYRRDTLASLVVTGASFSGGYSLDVYTTTQGVEFANATIRGVLSNGRLQIATLVANAFGNGTLTIAGTGAQYRLVDWTVVR
ncbi:MAG TPA: hypothetical protein VIJ77_06435 [Candidatus Tumulicola sp.]